MFQRFALFTATWFVYKAFGLGGAKAVAVITLQAVIAVSVDMLPLPGGMGISEKLFAMIFIPVFGKRLLLPGNDPEPWDWILYRAGAERLCLRS